MMIMIIVLNSCNKEIETVIYGNGETILNDINLQFNQDEFEREKYFGNNTYSSSSYILSLDTKDFEDLNSVSIVLESTNNPNDIRIPIFEDEKGKIAYKEVIQLEENMSYEVVINYYAIHRYENNDWNGDIKISLLYMVDGEEVKEILSTYTFLEPAAPTVYDTFYEVWKYSGVDIYKVNFDEKSNTATLDEKWRKGEDNRPTFGVYYKVTRIFNSYQSKVKDNKYNNGYVSYVVELITFYDLSGASWSDSMNGKKLYSKNIESMSSEELALKAWRSGTTILEVNENNKNPDYLENVSANCYIYNTITGKEFNVEVSFDVYLYNEYLYDVESFQYFNDYGIKITKTEPLYDFNKAPLDASNTIYIKPASENIISEHVVTSDVYGIKGVNDTAINYAINTFLDNQK